MSSRATYGILRRFVLISGFSIFSGCEPTQEPVPEGAEAPAKGTEGSQTTVVASAPTTPPDASGTQASKTETALSTTPPANSTTPEAAEPPAVRLPSGVSFTVLRPGTGEPVKDNATIQVHWRAWINNNAQERQIVSDTRRGGVPATCRLSEDPLAARARPQTLLSGSGGPERSLVPGVYEGIRGMRKGEWRRIFVPSALAYGKEGYPAVVPRRADLHLEVELVDFAAN